MAIFIVDEVDAHFKKFDARLSLLSNINPKKEQVMGRSLRFQSGWWILPSTVLGSAVWAVLLWWWLG